MSNLERRYRTLLKVLPRWYRDDREEEMVGLFMMERTDELDLEHSWPGWGETWAMLGLAVRTRFAATSAPTGAIRLGEVVRTLGLLGLLLGLTSLVPVVYSTFVQFTDPGYARPPVWAAVANFAPVVVFALLLRGQRTWAKVIAGALLVVSLVQSGTGATFVLWQLPHLVAFACLCLGFHREAPTPQPRPLLWWGGGAVLLGAVELAVWQTGLPVLAAAVLGMRIYAYVRGDAVLGRALSVLAVLLVGPLVVTYVSGPPEFTRFVVVAAALLVVSAAAPVRRGSALRSRQP